MKKIFTTLAIILSQLSYAETYNVIDDTYLLENYNKTKYYNLKLHILKNNLENIHNIKFDDIKQKDSLIFTQYNEIRNDYIKEINEDIEIAVFFISPDKAVYSTNSKVVNKKNNTKNDLTEITLNFLNDMYNPLVDFKKSKVLENDF